MRRSSSIALLSVLTTAPAAARPPLADGGQKTAAEIVPESVVAFAHVRKAGGLVKQLLDLELRRRFEASDAYKAWRATPGFTRAAMGLAFFQGLVGRSLWDAIQVAASRDAAIAIRPGASGGGPDVLLLLRGDDEEAADEILQGLARLAYAGGQATRRVEERAGATLHSLRDRLHAAHFGKTLAVASSLDLLRESADLNAKAGGGLAASARFRDAQSRAPRSAALFGFVDLERIAAARPDGKLFPSAFENAIGAIVFADLAPALRDASHATLALSFEPAGATLDVRVPAGAGATPATPAPAVPRIPRLLGSLALSRDLTSFWGSREKLLQTDALSGLAQFNSFMGVLFSGKSLGDDILPQIQPDLLLVSARQGWPEGSASPSVKIPGFALVLHLRDAKRFGPRFEVAFQTAMGVINADRGQKGKEPFLVRTVSEAGLDVTTARPLLEDARAPLPQEANFSPSVALAGQRFILSSSRGLAVDLARAYQRGDLEPEAAADRLALRAGEILETLRENEENLIAGEMLKKGTSRAEATASIRLLLEIVGLFESAVLERVTEAGAGSTGFRLRVALRRGV
jgi:hypothetical protein